MLARWVTLNDYFHLTDRPYETFRPDPDSYRLSLPGPGGRPSQIRSRSPAWRGTIGCGARFERLRVDPGNGSGHLAPPQPDRRRSGDAAGTVDGSRGHRELIETGRHADAASGARRAGIASGPDSSLAGSWPPGPAGSSGSARAGYLVINPLGVPRRVAVILPDAALDLRPEGPLRAAQFTDEGVYAVVDLPAFGFAWVPAEPNLELPAAAPGGLSARGRTLKNESIELEIDEATGGSAV